MKSKQVNKARKASEQLTKANNSSRNHHDGHTNVLPNGRTDPRRILEKKTMDKIKITKQEINLQNKKKKKCCPRGSHGSWIERNTRRPEAPRNTGARAMPSALEASAALTRHGPHVGLMYFTTSGRVLS